MNEQFEPLDGAQALQENLVGPPVQEAQHEVKNPIRRARRKEPITTMTLTSSTCRWPFGDPAEPDFHYCGQLSQTHGPYCDRHEAMSRPSGRNRASAAAE
jgi:hypothetical protein